MHYNIEKINSHIYKIDEFGLGSMYIVLGSNKNALIDTGTGVGHLRETLETLSNKPYVVICTHGHVDHVGGIGQFDEVYLHDFDREQAMHVDVLERQQYASNILKNHPNPMFELTDIVDYGALPKIKSMRDGDVFDLGDRQLEVLHTPGHTPGSVCLLDRKDGVLFSGDNTQHLQLLTMPSANRLSVVENWLKGLEKISELKDQFSLLLGGHEPLEIEILDDLMICGKGMIDGTIKAKQMKVHIFEAAFAAYGRVLITNDLIL